MGEEKEAGFTGTPRDWARHWKMELDAARKRLEKWHEQGEKIDKRFRDERESKKSGDTRWNFFASDVETKLAMLYGQTPKVSVARRFADSADDEARAAGEALERLLNSDIDCDGDGYADALELALQDRLLPGISVARVRYEAEFEDEEVPAKVDEETGQELAPGYTQPRRLEEDAETDYVHWKDFLWSPARVWGEVRWVAFRAELGREELVEMFGPEVGKAIPMGVGRSARDMESREQRDEPWHRAEVWEIWSKEHEQVFHWVDGFATVLFPVNNPEGKDPLGLEGFFPCPRPIFANATTSALIPRPDFVLAQDLYDEIDTVSTRITLLERAVRVAGVYNKAGGAIARLIGETAKNELIPVDNWALFAEKGGIKGQIDWLPLEQIVNAMAVLRDYRNELIEAKHQLTGMADIMRGQAATAGASATEQAIKARFGSARLQRLQDEFARFATDLQKLKAEIIAKHFDPQTIVERSNILRTPDAPLAQGAVQLIKSDLAKYRIEVKPEAVSMQDFAALKSERMEVLTGLANFFQAVAPIMQQSPASAPLLLQVLQWTLAGVKGSSQIEGVIDQAIAQAQQAAAQPQQSAPDPRLMAAQMKSQADLAKEQAKLQADLVRIQAETQADDAREQSQARWNVSEAAQKAAIQRAFKPQEPAGGGFGNVP